MRRRKIPRKSRKPRYRAIRLNLDALYRTADDLEFIYREEIAALRENILLHRWEGYL